MKEIKEKPTKRVPRSNAAGKIPKAALKKAWTEAKEKSRTKLRESISTQGEGNYTTAQDTAAMLTDTSYSAIKQNTDFTVEQGRKLALKQIEKCRERRAAEQTETTRTHTAGEHNVSPLLPALPLPLRKRRPSSTSSWLTLAPTRCRSSRPLRS